MESSDFQGTLGKYWLGIKVVNVNGQKLSLINAVGRFFSRFLCYFTFRIGYLIVAFTRKKQGLHDFVAKTYVIKFDKKKLKTQNNENKYQVY